MRIQRAIPIALSTAVLAPIPAARVEAYEIKEKTYSVKVTSLADFGKCNDEIDPEAWTQAQGREMGERWRGSGQSAAAFAAQHHISTARPSYWSKQLGLIAVIHVADRTRTS